jgi:hypothetical protein
MPAPLPTDSYEHANVVRVTDIEADYRVGEPEFASARM